MELKVNPEAKTLTAGLYLTDDHSTNILVRMKEWIKTEMRKEKSIDKLSALQYAASICEGDRAFEAYTFLAINMDIIVEYAKQELHEETCERCKARREREEQEGGVSIEHLPGLTVVTISI